MRDYFGCHNHSQYSNIKIIDSINRFNRMVDYAWDLGMSGIVMTEHDCLSGTMEAMDVFRAKLDKEWEKIHPDEENKHDYAAMSKELDFKVALGNEIYISEEGANEDMQRSKDGCHFWHFILIAKDAEGFKQLKRLSSSAWKRAWFRGILRTPTYPSDLIREIHGGHLIGSTACLGSNAAYRWKMFRDTKDPEQINRLDQHFAGMENLFGKGNFFVEIQPNEPGSEQNEYNKFLIDRYWGKYPFIFTTDAHYLKADEREIHKAFLNSKSSSDREVDDFYKYTYIMSEDEVWEHLKDYTTREQFDEMVANSRKIKDMCEFYTLEQKAKLATVEYEHWDEYKDDLVIFDDVDKETYPNFYWFVHSIDNKPANYLARLVAHGYVQKHEADWNQDEYYSRLEEEFWTLKQVGDIIEQPMSDYFITMSKIIELCWDDADSIVGPSRGSAGALFINYLLGITQMNPIKMNLPFVWRFLHPSRPDLPDIDFDTESNKRAAVFNAVRNYFNKIGGDVINVCTFGTEGTKSAIKTAARGLKIDDDVVSYITSMIPNERGFDWSLHDCYYGNDDDRKPIKAFVEQMNQYPRLWELAQNIEGLITRLGVHASGVVCVNDDFNNYNSYMKTNKMQLVTSYDLHTLERCGLVKYDFLTVSALDRIRQCLNYMLEDGTMQWQGTLRKTYDKYLNPAVIDYDSKEMWNMADEGKISSLFQFDTVVGSQSIKKIQPHSLVELAISNSIMRLMSDGEEQPIDIYVKHKLCPEIWYNEMRDANLNADEIKVLEKYLKEKCGVADSQEVIMQLSMEPKISGFTMKEANKLRKTIAKKKFREIEVVKELFYKKGLELGNRKEILDYVWNNQVSLQLGYSFSTIHTTAYSIIAVQEMNLAYHYPIIYWNCACLSVDSSAISSQDFYNLIDNDIIEYEDENEEGKKTINKMDYAKMASALDKFKNICQINMPDINKSRLSFTPDVKTNSILYGLKGICQITDPTIKEIMDNRPFNSFKDFLERMPKKKLPKNKAINLIKCGAFDNIEHKSREEIMREYLTLTSEPKAHITMQNAQSLIARGLFPQEYSYNCDVYLLTKELRRHRDLKKIWYCCDALDIPEDKIETWRNIFKDSKIEGKHLIVDGEEHAVLDSSAWDSFYKIKMIPLQDYIKKNQNLLLKELNDGLFSDEWNKYASGTLETWELDSMNFYFHRHPLAKVERQIENKYEKINISHLDEIVEGAADGQFIIKGKVIPKMKLYSIIGTVIDRDKVKGTVTLQCPSGVINVKVYKDLYSTMVQVLGKENENSDDYQDSFFEKGVNLIITGIQRGVTFIPKVYKNTGYQSIMKINLDDNGDLVNLEEKRGE